MNEITTHIDTEAIERLMLEGDLSRLTPEQRLQFYKVKCEAIGLDATALPFQYMRLSGKLTLYATKACAEQLRAKHGVSISNLEKDQIGDIFVVTVTASLPDGRTDTDLGSVPTNGMNGEKLANAYLKAITKAKRRVTLSLLGLGMLDETEVETIAGAQTLTQEQAMQIEAEAPEPKTLLDQSDINDEVNIKNAKVTKVQKRSNGKTTWWNVDIAHPAEQFTTFSETFKCVCEHAHEYGTAISALLQVKAKKDGGKIFNCKDVIGYEGEHDVESA